MIKYNKVAIEGDYLVLDFEVENKEYYNTVSISGVQVDNPLTYNKDNIYVSKEDEDDVTRYIKEIFIPSDKNNLLLITPMVYTEEIPEEVPCKDKIAETFIVYNKHIITKKGLNYLKGIADNKCAVPKEFIDYILLTKALDLAIYNCNYPLAVEYWNKLNSTSSVNTILKNCGCNG